MDRQELAQICAEIEKAGGSVREYLHDIGFLSPWGTWYRLQIEELGRKRHQIKDGKGTGDMKRKITLAQKKRAVSIALNGGNPLPYLRECGSVKPDGLWYTIKQDLKKVDPETYEKLPKRVGNAQAEETKSELEGFEPFEKKDGRRRPVTTCCAPSTREGVSVPDELPEEPEKKEEKAMENGTVEFNGKIYEPAEKEEPEQIEPDPLFTPVKRRLIDKDQFVHDLCVTSEIVQIITRARETESPLIAVLNTIRELVEKQPEVES